MIVNAISGNIGKCNTSVTNLELVLLPLDDTWLPSEDLKDDRLFSKQSRYLLKRAGTTTELRMDHGR